MKFAIVVFPGSNCDHDAYHVAKHVLGQDAELVWHKDRSLGNADVVILPGGFAHGDYLRTGAIARFSPIMQEVSRFAAAGGPVLGICNGFQILLEAGLLPGAMLRNRGLRFCCEYLHLKVEQIDTPFTTSCRQGQTLRLPIAHGDGNYYAEPDVIGRLERNRQVIFRYVSADGQASDEANPNGSAHNIAGICNEARNVVGLMPHPERACELAVGSADGLTIFESVLKWGRESFSEDTLATAAAPVSVLNPPPRGALRRSRAGCGPYADRTASPDRRVASRPDLAEADK